MPLPAMNKWTKVAPTVAHVLLLSFFHGGFIVDAVREEFGELEDESDDDSNAADERLGVPINEAKRWRILARRRNLRAAHYLGDPQTQWVNMVWVLLAEPLMMLHGSLFSSATWYSDRDRDKASAKAPLVEQFCTPWLNPANKILQTYLTWLQNPDASLLLLRWNYGRFADWPATRRRILRRVFFVAMGQVARKLVFPWLQFPWRLYPLVREEATPEERIQCAQDLLEAPECCVDTGFSARLRALAPDHGSLLDPRLQQFLQHVFLRLVPSSTFIERKFANFASWTPCGLPGLSAKHITQSFKQSVDAWRSGKESKLTKTKKAAGQADHKCRPLWVKQKSPRTNGLNVFAQQFREQQGRAPVPGLSGKAAGQAVLQQAALEWKKLSPADKAPYSARARGQNLAKAQAQRQRPANTSEDGGPWQMSSLQGRWPLRAEVLARARAGSSSLSAFGRRWEQESGRH
jgi:hypothetical protein